MKFIIKKTFPNLLVHYLDQEEIWASRNYSLYLSNDKGNTFNKIINLKVPVIFSLLGQSRIFSRALRLGVRTMRKLKSGTILVIANRNIYRLDNSLRQFKQVHSFKKGFGPLREGWCEDEEGNCYVGEYFLNNQRKYPVNLLKSSDDGYLWRIIRTLNNIRHIHCVQYDLFTKSIWMGTGDWDKESSLSFSKNKGETWMEVGSGNQMFRTVSLIFTKDYVYWGSDIPTRQNYLYRYVRENSEIEKLTPVNGPVYYSTILQNGIMLFATTVEGNSEGKSAEWDKKAHLWASIDGIRWEDLMSWEKDRWPYHFGYGKLFFAHGQFKNKAFFTTSALKKVDGLLYIIELSK